MGDVIDPASGDEVEGEAEENEREERELANGDEIVCRERRVSAEKQSKLVDTYFR